MLLPRLYNRDFFDDFFDFGWPQMPNVEKQLYGKRAGEVMKTDVKEHDDHYEIAIDLPGFKKEEVTLTLENGYLTVDSAKGLDKDENDKKGKLSRQERYCGAMQRSYYVGEDLTEEDIKAKYEDGILTLDIPKKEAQPVVEQKRFINID